MFDCCSGNNELEIADDYSDDEESEIRSNEEDIKPVTESGKAIGFDTMNAETTNVNVGETEHGKNVEEKDIYQKKVHQPWVRGQANPVKFIYFVYFRLYSWE